MTELIKKFRSSLEHFDYPNINFLDDEQVASLFTAENRKFIVTWLVQNLSKNISLPSEWTSAECLIADFLHESGFCKASQKHSFVTGHTKLPVEDQILIFERIFNYLEIIKLENIPPMDTTKYNIEVLIDTDINIFPTLGPPKLFSSNEKQQHLEHYHSNIAQLKKDIEELNNANPHMKSIYITEPCDINDIDNSNFHSKAIKVKEAVVANEIYTNPTEDQLEGFKSEFGEDLERCSVETHKVVQYQKNLSITLSSHNKAIEELCLQDDEFLKGTLRNASLASDTAKTIIAYNEQMLESGNV